MSPHRRDDALGKRSRRLIQTLRIPGEAATIDRVMYATITIMSVLIIYDGWEKLHTIDVIGIIFGPIFAMFIAHVFSASLARKVAEGRRLLIP